MHRRGLLAGLAVMASRARAEPDDAGSTRPGTQPPTTGMQPFGAEGTFVNRLDATFGRTQRDATIRTKAELDRIAYFRFIYGDAATTGDGTDGLYGNYRSRHRDYPGSDPRSLHDLDGDALVLKAHCGLDGGSRTDCADGHIESGIVRFALPIRPGSYIETRCRMPSAPYAWPAFWLNPGQQFPVSPGTAPRRSTLSWPPEIDIFDQFGFNGVPPGQALISALPTGGNDAAYGHPHDTFKDPAWGGKWYFQPKQDLTAAAHVYALDWRTDNRLRFVLDGHVYREAYYEWNSKDDVPAHLIASLQIGPKFNDLGRIADGGDGWDWPISYVRVWTRTG